MAEFRRTQGHQHQTRIMPNLLFLNQLQLFFFQFYCVGFTQLMLWIIFVRGSYNLYHAADYSVCRKVMRRARMQFRRFSLLQSLQSSLAWAGGKFDKGLKLYFKFAGNPFNFLRNWILWLLCAWAKGMEPLKFDQKYFFVQKTLRALSKPRLEYHVQSHHVTKLDIKIDLIF